MQTDTGVRGTAHAAGKEHSHHFKRKVDAQRWLDEVTTAVTTGMYVDPGRSQVGDWAQRWIETKVNLKPSTHAAADFLRTEPQLIMFRELDQGAAGQ